MDQLIQLVNSVGGPAAPIAVVFAYLFWNERAERRENAKASFDLAIQTVEALKDSKAAVDMLRVAMGTKAEPPTK